MIGSHARKKILKVRSTNFQETDSMGEQNMNEDFFEDEEIQETENTTADVQDKKNGGNPYLKVIQDYLEKQVSEDPGFKNNYIPDRTEKCFEYIRNNASKQKVGNCAVVEDSVVFKWARDYFNDGIALKEFEEESARKKSENEKRRKAEEEKRRAEEYRKFMEKPVPETSSEERKKEMAKYMKAEQLSLFDF